MGSEGEPCETVEARIDLGVLRRVLAGGLLTNERVARHRMDGGSRECYCGAAEATVEHVTWECPRWPARRGTPGGWQG